MGENMGAENLIPLGDRTIDERREIAKKAGQASGEARKRKANIRRTVQGILDGTYTDKNGTQKTGAEIAAIALYKVATDPRHKQFVQAQRLLYELTGQDLSPEDKKRIKLDLKTRALENELLQKKIDAAEEDW